MAALDMAIKSGIKLVGGKGTSVLRSVTENGTVVQKAVSKDGVTKVVTFAEGSPMHKLGITDSVYIHAKEYERLSFYKNANSEYVHLDTIDDDLVATAYINNGRVCEGSLEKAKGFLEAIKELVRNGGKISS